MKDILPASLDLQKLSLYTEHQTRYLILYSILEKWNKDTGIYPVIAKSIYVYDI